MINSKDKNLYGSPANGNAMTTRLIPTALINAITQLVHPYVKIPKTVARKPKLDPFPLLALNSTNAVEKFIIKVLNKAITIFIKIFSTTNQLPYVRYIS